MNRLAFVVILILFPGIFQGIWAQKVQWASKVLSFSSEYKHAGFPRERGVNQILGPPSVMPDFGDTPCAWAPSSESNEEGEYLILGFQRPQTVRQVLVAEVNNPGALVAVYLIDTKNNSHQVYTNESPMPVMEIGRIFPVVLPEATSYRVKAVRLEFNTARVFGWNQIDAVGISGSAEPFVMKVNVAEEMLDSLEIEKLGPQINSRYDELCPVISADGKTLYFTRDRHPGNLGERHKQDIWRAGILEDGSFATATNMGGPLNNEAENALTSVTPDGQTVTLLNVYRKDGRMAKGVSQSRRSGSGWTFPEKIRIRDYYNRQSNAEYCLHSSGKIMILTLQRDDTYGGKDLYICFKQSDGSWSVPKNLGPTVNTAASETSPFLASDGKTLYFSTAGLPGYGRNDMFVSRRKDATWTHWTEPENLGPKLNSSSWDAYYTLPASGEYAYYVSYADRSQGADIYRAKLPDAVKPDPVVLIHGKVYDNSTQKVLGAEIRYEILSSSEQLGVAYSDPVTGEYSITIPAGEVYGFLAASEGYFSQSENINLKELDDYQEIEQDLFLAPAREGQTLVMRNIFFAASSAKLSSDSQKELDRVRTFLLENPTMRIEVGGHTNNACQEAYCKKLSTARAKVIVDWLSSHGIDRKRLTYKGYGSTKPLMPNDTREGLRRNRRVDFTILDL